MPSYLGRTITVLKTENTHASGSKVRANFAKLKSRMLTDEAYALGVRTGDIVQWVDQGKIKLDEARASRRMITKPLHIKPDKDTFGFLPKNGQFQAVQLDQAVVAILLAPDEDGLTKRDLLANLLVDRALDGDKWAAQLIVERVWPKKTVVEGRIEHDVNMHENVLGQIQARLERIMEEHSRTIDVTPERPVLPAEVPHVDERKDADDK